MELFIDHINQPRIEIEEGLISSTLIEELKWTFTIDCKKFSTISNITLLFRGCEEEGLYRYLKKGTLYANNVELDQLKSDDEDCRVCEFSKFMSLQPLPLFAFDTLKIVIEFLEPHTHSLTMLRIIADVSIQKEKLTFNDFIYSTDHFKFILQDGDLSIEKAKYQQIMEILNESEDEIIEEDFDLGLTKSRLLSYDLDYYVTWKTQRKLLLKSKNALV
jgi:hypothetical protein